MILLRILLLFAAIMSTMTAPNLSHTIAKINEAKARAVANRAKLRANNVRIMNQLSNPMINRSKRQSPPDTFNNALSGQQSILGGELDTSAPRQPDSFQHIVGDFVPQEMLGHQPGTEFLKDNELLHRQPPKIDQNTSDGTKEAEERCHKEKEEDDEYEYRREAEPVEPIEVKEENFNQHTQKLKEAEERCGKEDEDEYEYRRESVAEPYQVKMDQQMKLGQAAPNFPSSEIEQMPRQNFAFEYNHPVWQFRNVEPAEGTQEMLNNFRGTDLRQAFADSQPPKIPNINTFQEHGTRIPNNQFDSLNIQIGPFSQTEGSIPISKGELHHNIQQQPIHLKPQGNQHHDQSRPQHPTRYANPHHHTYTHSHQHTVVHGHQPSTHVVHPSLNVNINNHAQISHPISHGSSGGVNTHHQSSGHYGSSSNAHHQSSSHFGSSSVDAKFVSRPKFREAEEMDKFLEQPLSIPAEVDGRSKEDEVREDTLIHKPEPNHSYNPRPQNQQREADIISELRQPEELLLEAENSADQNAFVGSPTFKKKGKTKHVTQYYPVYSAYNKPPQHYREAEQLNFEANKENGPVDNAVSDFMVGTPTHKKKKKVKYVYDYVPVYMVPQSSYYREADGEKQSQHTEQPQESKPQNENEDFVVGTFKKKHKKKKTHNSYHYQPQYYQYYPASGGSYYREAGEPEAPEEATFEDFDLSRTASPYLFNFRHQPVNEHFKRSVNPKLSEIPKKYFPKKQQHDSKKESTKKRTRRSLPLTRLISDPYAKLDVPKTFENFGTATKNAFEDDRTPVYHVKRLVGSSKNALLSAMRVPPQNLIIPSDYEIVKNSDDEDQLDNEEDPLRLANTFKRVGEIVRESVKSGQETVGHINDIAHDARNILHTARYGAPTLITPYVQAPVVTDPRTMSSGKTILIGPRILDVTQQRLGQKPTDFNPKFVKLGHVMDAVGISKPNAADPDWEKFTFEHGKVKERRLSNLHGRTRSSYTDAHVVGEALDTLEDAKVSVGAKNFRDFLIKMRDELTAMVQSHPEEMKPHGKKMKKQKSQELNKFVENLFDGNEVVSKYEQKEFARAPKLHHRFKEDGPEKKWDDFWQNEQAKLEQHEQHNSHSDSLLGAINPIMLQRLYNETVEIKSDASTNPAMLFGSNLQEVGPRGDQENTVGTAMTINDDLLKPFMGRVKPKDVEKLLYPENEKNEEVQSDEY